MSINQECQAIGESLLVGLGRPRARGLYLPAPVEDETFRDEFGFLFLTDGNVGPFYVSMGGILKTLWARYPRPQDFSGDLTELLAGWAQSDLSGRALALGAYNALSSALFRTCGFEPPDRLPGSGLDGTPSGIQVGMVGYFCPLVDRLVAQGCEVLILEQTPQRVPMRDAVSATLEPQDLQRCELVLCTASTLINGTLDHLLQSLAEHTRFELIGPSGSGLPDPLFARGVAAVGGIRFADQARLLELLDRGESWGAAGRKYQLTPEDYPGLVELAARI